MRRWLPLLLVLSGCLPERDNGFDPARSPAAVVDVLDRTGTTGGCLAVATSAAWPAISEGSRGRCLALSGWRTQDPQGTPAAELLFTFERVDDAGNVLATYQDGVQAPLVLLPERVLGDLPDGATARFRLTARDDSGAVGSAIAEVVARNAPPVAFTQESRTIPLHGFPWAALNDAPADVPFVGRATDPDGDADLVWEWLDESGNVVATTSNATISVATDKPVRRVFRLRVGDGELFSDPEPVTLFVGSPNIWTSRHSPSDPFSLEIMRLDSSFRRPKAIDSFALSSVLAVAVDDGGSFVALLTLTDVIVATWPDLTLVTSAPIPYVPGEFEAPVTLSVESDEIWVGGSYYLPSTGGLGMSAVRWTYANGALTFAGGPVTAYSSHPGNMTGRDLFTGIDGAGRFWTTAQLTPEVRAIDPVTLTTSFAMDLTSQVWSGLARQPNGPMWAVTGRRIGGGGTVGTAEAYRFVEDGAGYRVDVFPLGGSAANGISWIDGDYFWTFLAERGACLVDAALLEVVSDPADAIPLCINTSETLAHVEADPVTGTAWWLSLLGTTGAITRPDGTLHLFFSGGHREVNAIDPAGSAWIVEIDPQLDTDGGPVAYGRTHEETNLLVSLPVSIGDATDDGFGGTWIATVQPALLRRVSEDGDVVDVITELDVGGVPMAVPLVGAMDDDLAGGLWVAGFDGFGASAVFLIDVRAPREFPFRAPAQRLSADSGFIIDGEIIGAAGPRSPAKQVWYRSSPLIFGTPYLRHLDTAGTQTNIMVLSGESERFGVASPAGDSFCYGHRLPAGIRLYRAEGGPPPTITLTTSWSIAGSAFLRGVGASSRPGTAAEDHCWMAIGNATGSPSLRIYAYDAAGNRVRTYEDDLGDIVSFSVVSPDEMWVLRDGTPPRPEFIQFKGPNGSVEGTLAPLDASRLVDR